MPDIYAIGLVIVLALAFDFINGFHDTANAIATCIATRSLSPRIAIIMSAFLNFVGAMVSTGVAKTIGGEIVTSPQMVDSTVLIAALFAAIVWNLFTWKIGMPSSSSHALIGGVLGAVTISYGTGAINGNGVFMIVAGLIGSPVIAMFSGYVIMTLLFILFRNVGRSKVNYISLHIQSLSAAVMAFSHGSNDAEVHGNHHAGAFVRRIHWRTGSSFPCKDCLCICHVCRDERGRLAHYPYCRE